MVGATILMEMFVTTIKEIIILISIVQEVLLTLIIDMEFQTRELVIWQIMEVRELSIKHLMKEIEQIILGKI